MYNIFESHYTEARGFPQSSTKHWQDFIYVINVRSCVYFINGHTGLPPQLEAANAHAGGGKSRLQARIMEEKAASWQAGAAAANNHGDITLWTSCYFLR